MPEAGVAFIESRIARRDPGISRPKPTDTFDAETLADGGRETVVPHDRAAVRIVALGEYDHRELVPHYGVPDDLAGQSCLDVGTADGFWAFEFERRGAR